MRTTRAPHAAQRHLAPALSMQFLVVPRALSYVTRARTCALPLVCVAPVPCTPFLAEAPAFARVHGERAHLACRCAHTVFDLTHTHSKNGLPRVLCVPPPPSQARAGRAATWTAARAGAASAPAPAPTTGFSARPSPTPTARRSSTGKAATRGFARRAGTRSARPASRARAPAPARTTATSAGKRPTPTAATTSTLPRAPCCCFAARAIVFFFLGLLFLGCCVATLRLGCTRTALPNPACTAHRPSSARALGRTRAHTLP